MTGVGPHTRDDALAALREARPRSRFLRLSAGAAAVIVAAAWAFADVSVGEFLSARRLANVERFAGLLAPYPLQAAEWDWSVALGWFSELMTTRGWAAAETTLAISVAAIVLSGTAALLVSFAASRVIATAEPYLPAPAGPSPLVRAGWNLLVALTRTLLIFCRAVPEYVWAFLLIAIVGPTPWAAVLALALHNAGVLGKLNAEVIENLEPHAAAALRGAGASRRQIAVWALMPALTPRFLLLFFYRWETCVREATVLGMLGIVSLGYFIQDARARQHYDAMFALILVGATIVLAGDFVSAAAREAVRRSR